MIYPSKAILPRHTTTRRFFRIAISSSTKVAHLLISVGNGLLPGGAQRTTDVMWRSFSSIPSSRDRAIDCDANPVSNNTGYKKFPDPSPVKGRPVRLEPCAPGASPSASTLASGSPKEGTGFPQYVWSAYARRRTRAISAQYVRRRGHNSQLSMRLASTLNCAAACVTSGLCSLRTALSSISCIFKIGSCATEKIVRSARRRSHPSHPTVETPFTVIKVNSPDCRNQTFPALRGKLGFRRSTLRTLATERKRFEGCIRSTFVPMG